LGYQVSGIWYLELPLTPKGDVARLGYIIFKLFNLRIFLYSLVRSPRSQSPFGNAFVEALLPSKKQARFVREKGRNDGLIC